MEPVVKAEDDIAITSLQQAESSTKERTGEKKRKKTISGQKLSEEKAIYQCNECGESFTREYYVGRHVLAVHRTDEQKPFKCTECPRAFSQHQALSRHLVTHTKEKKFSCVRCNKLFGFKSNLDRHKRNICYRWEVETKADPEIISKIPGVLKPHQCSLCGKRFSFQSNLERHNRHVDCYSSGTPKETGSSYKGKKYKCKTCGKIFGSTYNLRRHRMAICSRKATLRCDVCSLVFHNNNLLRNHKNPICHKNDPDCFRSSEGFYPCQLCFEKFFSLYSLQCHLKKVCFKIANRNANPEKSDEEEVEPENVNLSEDDVYVESDVPAGDDVGNIANEPDETHHSALFCEVEVQSVEEKANDCSNDTMFICATCHGVFNDYELLESHEIICSARANYAAALEEIKESEDLQESSTEVSGEPTESIFLAESIPTENIESAPSFTEEPTGSDSGDGMKSGGPSTNATDPTNQHRVNRNTQCSICKRMFKSYQAVNAHVKIHRRSSKKDSRYAWCKICRRLVPLSHLQKRHNGPAKSTETSVNTDSSTTARTDGVNFAVNFNSSQTISPTDGPTNNCCVCGLTFGTKNELANHFVDHLPANQSAYAIGAHSLPIVNSENTRKLSDINPISVNAESENSMDSDETIIYDRNESQDDEKDTINTQDESHTDERNTVRNNHENPSSNNSNLQNNPKNDLQSDNNTSVTEIAKKRLPYSCYICLERFATKQVFAVHFSKTHQDPSLSQYHVEQRHLHCSLCNKNFGTYQAANAHQRKHRKKDKTVFEGFVTTSNVSIEHQMEEQTQRDFENTDPRTNALEDDVEGIKTEPEPQLIEDQVSVLYKDNDV